MRVLILTAGSHGDVHPFLAIGRALVRCGHDPILMTNPYFERDTAAAGIAFEPHGDHIDLPAFIREQRLMHPTRGPLNVFRWIFENTPTLLRQADDAITRLAPDVVLHHMICFGIPWLCRRRGVPLATACLQPAAWFSPSDPVPAIQREPGPADARVSRALLHGIGPLTLAAASWKMNRLRLACGFSKERDAIARDFRGGDLNLGLWSTEFRGPMADDPANAIITGFPLYDGGARRPMPPELEAFLDAGPPPVVFALGTTAVHVAGEFYRHAAEVCRRLGCRGVLLCGDAANAPRRLPPGVIAIPYAPFSRILSRGAVSVVHGGIGSVAQALSAGRPTVVAPFSHDQFNNGVRVQRLGVGLTLGTRPVTVERLAQVVQACLTDSSMAARAVSLGAALSVEDGAACAAAAVERLIPAQPEVRAAANRVAVGLGYQQTEIAS